MPNTRISGLPETTLLGSDDEFVVVQNGVTKKITANQVVNQASDSEILYELDVVSSNESIREFLDGLLPDVNAIYDMRVGAYFIRDKIYNTETNSWDDFFPTESDYASVDTLISTEYRGKTFDWCLSYPGGAEFNKKNVFMYNKWAKSLYYRNSDGSIVEVGYKKASVTVGSSIYPLRFVQTSSTSSGEYVKSSLGDSNAVPVVDTAGNGIKTGNVDPYLIPFNSQIRSIMVSLPSAGMSGAVPSEVNLNVGLYRIKYDSKELIQTIRLPLDASKVGANTNMPTDDASMQVLTSDLSITLNAGDLVGIIVERTESTDLDYNAYSHIVLNLETTE